MMDYGYEMSPWMWLGGVLMISLFVAALVLVAAWGTRAGRGSRPADADAALAVLGKRLASGAITTTEYDSARRAIEG